MSFNKVGFGIIGTGAVAAVHAQAITGSDYAFLAAVYDVVPERAREFAKKYNTTAVADFGEFLQTPGLEAVTVATPSGFHHDPVVAAAKAGKHILCEKPLDITLAKIDDMIRVADENKVLLAAVFQSRFKKAVAAIRKALDEGRFGKLVSVSAKQLWFRDESYYKSASWRGTWAVDGGGALMNQGSHTVDLLLYLGGEVKKISGHTSNILHQIEVEDSAFAQIDYVCGASGTLEVSTACKPGYPVTIEVTGTTGSAILKADTLARWSFVEERPEDEKIRQECAEGAAHSGGAGAAMDFDCHGHRAHVDNLARAIRNGEKLMLSGRDGRLAVEFIQAVYESSRTGLPVILR